MDDSGDGDFFCESGGDDFFGDYHNPIPFLRDEGEARHLTTLKLGKRQYFEETGTSDPTKEMKREKPATAVPRVSYSSQSSSPPTCQVEGCNAALADAKEYYRRHKVCNIHSKASKVVVHGVDQRFCQQCSRFHVITEFDESKRSCRRRLAGHNERRRKSSAEYLVRNDGGRALPLLSSASSPPSICSSADLSHQSSAALRELIAENRAAVLADQLLSGGGVFPLTRPPQEDGWNHLRGPADVHVTLDLMQTSIRPRPSDEDEECCGIWKSLEGAHVV